MEDLLKLINDFPLNSVIKDTTGNVGYVSGHLNATYYSDNEGKISQDNDYIENKNLIRVFYLGSNHGWWMTDSIVIVDQNTPITEGPPDDIERHAYP